MKFNDLCPDALPRNPFVLKDVLNGIKKHAIEPECNIEKYAIGKEWGTLKIGASSKRYFSLIRADINSPCPTLSKSCASNNAASVSHPFECRKFSGKELKAIASFPLRFQHKGAYVDFGERIGNSVPPGLMRAVALNVKHRLFGGEPLTPYPKAMSYLEILEATWQDHLTPKAEDAPTVISTFAGGGGSSLGYSMAGFKELLAVEMDNNAVETFKLNFPEVPVFHGDIGALSVEECLSRARLSAPGDLDVLDGSPPCQGFSTAGKRQMSDNRNQLFQEYVRLLRGLQPKAFIMENVSGMVKGKMKLIFAEILRELKASGYEVKAWLLNAKYFYVPQSRERMIFIGVRHDVWQEIRDDEGER